MTRALAAGAVEHCANGKIVECLCDIMELAIQDVLLAVRTTSSP
jgi:hypothetical protein